MPTIASHLTMIAGFLETLAELDVERSQLENEMTELRAGYKLKIDAGEDLIVAGRCIHDQAVKIGRIWARIASYYKDSIPRARGWR